MYKVLVQKFNVPTDTKFFLLLLPTLLIIDGDWLITGFYVLIFFSLFLLNEYKFNNLDVKLPNIFMWTLLLIWGVFIIIKSPEPGIGVRYYFATIFIPLLIFIIFNNIDLTPEFLDKFFFYLFIVGAILGAYSLYVFICSGFNTRLMLRSLWQDYNIMATFLMILSMFNISYILNRAKNEKIIPYIITLVFIYLGIFLAQTRGVWLAIVLSFLLYIVKKPKIIVPAFILFLVFSLLFSNVILYRFLSVKNFGYDESSLGRLQAWYATYLLLKANLFFGYGFDAFIHHRDSILPFYIVKVLHSHNTYLRTILEMGFIGFILYFSFIFRASFYSFFFKKGTDFFEKYKVYIEGLQLSFIGLYITFIFEPYFSLYGASALVIWILISLSFRLRYYEKSSSQQLTDNIS